MAVTIRALKTSERSNWEFLFRSYAAFYETETNQKSEDQVFQWIFDENIDFWCDVAVDDNNELIGFVQYQLMHRSLSGSMVCYLSDLYVDPGLRSKGVGRMLIDHVFKFAANRGISNVRWLTQEFNYNGRRLYDTYAKKSDFVLYSINVH